jgi:hypothetical protein
MMDKKWKKITKADNLGRLATVEEIQQEIRDIVSNNEGVLEFSSFDKCADAAVDFLEENNFFED